MAGWPAGRPAAASAACFCLNLKKKAPRASKEHNQSPLCELVFESLAWTWAWAWPWRGVAWQRVQVWFARKQTTSKVD